MQKRVIVICVVLAVSGVIFLLAGFWIPVKAVVAQHLLQKAWQQSMACGDVVKPWPWADSWPVGRLINKRLGIDYIILEGDSGEVLAFGPGHIPRSGMPGQEKHCILAGHRDTNFSFLQKLVTGDILIVEGRKKKKTYRVVAMEVAEADHLYFDLQDRGALTLITCFPFDAILTGGGQRFIVSARD